MRDIGGHNHRGNLGKSICSWLFMWRTLNSYTERDASHSSNMHYLNTNLSNIALAVLLSDYSLFLTVRYPCRIAEGMESIGTDLIM